jgi:hypothetical protein
VVWRDTRTRTEIEADRRYAAFRAVSGHLDAVLQRNIREGRPVSKLAAMADRIASKKAAHDRKADEWAARLDALEKQEPLAFAAGDAVIAEREADVAQMEATMRSLSNLPLADFTPSSEG